MSALPSLYERIANLALDRFDTLPSRCKPRQLLNGSREWTPLSAVILTKHNSHANPPILKVVSLGTGTKSLPVSALPKCQGLILHDCHAEILALRGLNYWLLCEMERISTQSDYESIWLERIDSDELQASPQQPFRIKQDIEISLFSTEAPCGDASMELLIAAAKTAGADVSPWPSSQVPSAMKLPNGDLPPGRGGFADLGALRRKPARADAEVSMSMSCTDKLMVKQFTSLIGFPIDMLLEKNKQAFLKNVIVYKDQYNTAGYSRAFGKDGRLKAAMDATGELDAVKPHFFDVEVLPVNFRRFAYERLRASSDQNVKSKVTNTSSILIASDPSKENSDIIEVLVNGVKQGYKQFDEKVKKGSVLCRYNMLQKALVLHNSLPQRRALLETTKLDGGESYPELKELPYRRNRKAAKVWILDKLGGWPKVAGDDFRIALAGLNQHAVPPYVLSEHFSRLLIL